MSGHTNGFMEIDDQIFFPNFYSSIHTGAFAIDELKTGTVTINPSYDRALGCWDGKLDKNMWNVADHLKQMGVYAR